MKPSILTFVSFYLPGYKSGGPVRAIANMVEQLGDEFDFHIVTADRDDHDTEPYPDVRIGEWNEVGKARVFYCSPRNRTLGTFRRLIGETPHDLVYLNSFFSTFTILPLVLRRFGRIPARPVLLAPHGEFSEGALALKQGKKRLYLGAVRAIGLYAGITWQATSEFEAADIRRTMGRVARRYVIAPNIQPLATAGGAALDRSGAREGPLRIVFLSRISPKKNLDFALRVLARVRVPVEFNIYGPADADGYWDHCRELIGELPEHVTATYHGPVEHTEVPKVMAENDLFFLPTLGENYGYVIPEALSAGTPVLISDTTPWRDLDRAGVGWDLPLDSEEAFSRRIEECAAMDGEAYSELRERAHSYARERLTDPQTVEAARQMFRRALEVNPAG